MIELFCFFSIFFIFVLGYIAWLDYKIKLVNLWMFYLINILWLVWLYFFWNIFSFVLMAIYLIVIFFLDILDYIWKLPKFITNDWMIGDTGVYDYWIYLFIISLFISYLLKDFFYYYIWFSFAIVIWICISYFLTRKKYSKHIPLFTYAFFIIFFMFLVICLYL